MVCDNSNPKITIGTTHITDYVVRVQVGKAGLVENNCKKYPNGTWKPVGLLQRNGESQRMMFGLITGSYSKNTSGGVLRKNISSITNEINLDTGQFDSSSTGKVKGIIYTLNQLKTVGFNHKYDGTDPPCKCGWYSGRLKDGSCSMWGNPVGEMMYEGLRYFAGKKTATAAYDYGSGTSVDKNVLALPRATWNDPYDPTSGFDYCAKPFMLVISDINITYDSDQLPGSYFGSFSGDTPGLNVESEADTISAAEHINGKDYYIGQSGTNSDFLPTPKLVSSLGNIRGLSPEETTKEGSYYAASIAYYGRVHDVNATASGDQNIITYSVGMASPLPQIKIPVGDKFVTLVPFAKTVSDSKEPTCGIVDFYAEKITPTSGTFRINFDDHELGGDYDMDAVVKYKYEVNGSDVTITLDSTYSNTGNMQHMGYIISGTNHDGIYLDVRFHDNSHKTGADDPDYHLDTPPGSPPGSWPVPDWKDGTPLPIHSQRIFTVGTSSGAEFLHTPLWYAAKWGAFEEDENGNNKPDRRSEWDADRNGVPDTYFYVTNPTKLEEQLNKSFADILRRTASGTAASVISSSRSGEGAVYQAIFYPEFKGDSGNTVNWVGDVNCFFIDTHGNIREDNNHNRTLELDKDRIIRFEDRTVLRYKDSNANGILDDNEMLHPVKIDFTEVKPLWTAGKWLNTMANSDEYILRQRNYTGRGQRRFLFTFLDKDGDMIPDNQTINNSGELRRFLPGYSSIYPYIHVIPKPFKAVPPPAYLSSSGIINNVGTVTNAAAYQIFADLQANRVIKFIRGQDQGELTSSGLTIPAMRSRQVNYLTKTNDQTIDTWRLGDIVSSTPTIVGRPAEHYDLLYADESYTAFRQLYRNRRQMVYVGGNDGILHAFNGGFFDSVNSKFWLGYNSGTDTFNDTGLPLGAEMWGYVPWNLLPHLSWLTEESYNTDYHVAYVDLKPRIFDGKVFTDDPIHPNGWGTIMVIGMRFGGGQIYADTNRDNRYTDSSGTVDEPSFTSAYIIMDITNPEAAPKLLAELTLPDLGFTTCYPTVVPMKDRDSSQDNNDWYLVFGSGPAPAVSNTIGDTLAEATSTQKGKLFILDLKSLVQNKTIKMIDNTGTIAAGIQTFAELDDNSFISDPVTVDYDLDYKADAVYFGTVAGDFTNGWSGKLRRIVIDDDDTTSNWTGDSVLMNLSSVHNGQPIVGAPTIAVDDDMNRWVYFGTGRFFNRLDITNAATAFDQQSFYGVKENRTYNSTTNEYEWDWSTIDPGDLLDVSGKVVFENNATSFNNLVSDVKGKKGWQLDFATVTERNLGQAALLGDIISFTTYKPSEDDCKIEGSSYLYALYYRTGSAYMEPIFGTDSNNEIKKVVDLGVGLTLTPNIHTGKDAGSKVFVQTSTGAIIGIKEANPGTTKSGGVYWLERMEE
jgi:type IV pilus assembly protein PilY1